MVTPFPCKVWLCGGTNSCTNLWLITPGPPHNSNNKLIYKKKLLVLNMRRLITSTHTQDLNAR